MECNAVEFIVPGVPQGWQRAGRSKDRYFTRPKTAAAQAGIRDACKAVFAHAPWTGPVMVEIVAIYPVPASWSRSRKEAAVAGATRPGKPDIDNIVKNVLDALNGVLWVDDAQVAHLLAAKRYGSEARLEVWAARF
jgi:Holliday junction resolvase RusA-like endonuclease